MIFIVLGCVLGGLVVGMRIGYFIPRRSNTLIDMDDLNIEQYEIRSEDFD